MFIVNKKIEISQSLYKKKYRSSRVLQIICLLVAALFHFTAANNTASAATYYLDAVNGDDANPGTSNLPWRTIGKAQSSILEGDTVILRAGNYGNFSDVTVRNNWVVWKSDIGHTPVFSGLSVGTGATLRNYYLWFEGITIQAFAPLGIDGRLVQTSNANYVKFINCSVIGAGYSDGDRSSGFYFYHSENIEIKGCRIYGTGPDPRMALDKGIYGRYSNHITVEDCDITKCGMAIHAWGRYWNIRNCELHDLNSDGILGTSVAEVLIEDNHIYNILRPAGTDFHCDCIQFFTPGGTSGPGPSSPEYVYCENIIIRRNHMHHSSGQIILWNDFAPEVVGGPGSKNIVVENNLMYSPDYLVGTGSATFYSCDTDGLTFVNNTAMGKVYFRYKTLAINMSNNILDLTDIFLTEGSTVDYENNNIVRTWWLHMPGYVQGEDSVELGSEQLFADLFADFATNDYRLASDSMAIDFGDPAYASANDILGVSRVFPPDVLPPDAGCYEYITSDPNIQTYSITASAGIGGQINPSGTTQVVSGSTQAYTITASTGYHIADVLVNGSSVGAVSSYTFTNVTANHTIVATFANNTHTITSSAGSGGQISPSGTTQVNEGASQTYTITTNVGYHISDVIVDGSSFGAVGSYTFTNVTANHTIVATFANNTYTITSSAGSGGQISPSGTTQVNEGASQTYTITANTGYHIVDVLVDGGSVGAVSSYTFINVTNNRTIAASFAIDEVDVTAPTVTNLSPEADSIQASLNTLVTLNITDTGDGVDADSVTIKVNGHVVYTDDTAKYSSASGECYRVGTEAKYEFTYQSNETFDFDQLVNVTVNASDLAGNVMDEYFYSFQTEMRSFGKNIIVDSDDLTKGGPVTVRDSSGNIWVAWHAGSTGNKDIYISKLTAGSEAFGNSIKLTDSSADQRNPAIAAGSDDKLYVAWQDSRGGNWDIYMTTSTDGINWSAETRVTDSNDNQINPAIAIDSSLPNNVYIAWEDGRNGNQDIYIGASNNGFVSTTTSQITSDLSYQIEPAIAVDSDNTVYVVWTDARITGKNDIYGAASNSSPWTNIPIVTEDESQSSPAIATEAAGSILHLVWVDDRDGENDIYYAKTNDGLPASPLSGSNIIDDTTDAEQKLPVIAVAGSTGSNLRVYACWQDERNGDDDLYLSEINSGSGTNVFVGDDGTNTDQIEPAIGIDGHGQPYLVWIDGRNMNTDIYYAGSTFIEPEVLASSNISTSSTVIVGTPVSAIDNLDDVSVEVPQGAYLCDIKISISKIQNSQEFNLEHFGGPYEFSPSGIDFIKPVTITIPYEATGSENITYTAYWYNPLTNALSQQGITDIETIVISPTLHALRFKTTHFTQFFVGGSSGSSISISGGGGGGGCSMSTDSQAGTVELLLPYIGLTIAMVILKLRDRRKRKSCNIT